MSDAMGSLQGHHHHHHHHHVDYIEPKELTTELGLFALKKINAIDPTFLRASEVRLFDQVNPGPITYLINGTFLLTAGAYIHYVLRGLGPKAFLSKPALPLLALVCVWKPTMLLLNYSRESLYGPQRRKLVNKYVESHGK